MTITYTDKVSNARLCAFSRLVFHWKGSIYKLMYKEMAIFCALYIFLSLLYRLALNEVGKRTFEKIALHCESFINLIPLSFVLGFYVALIIGRWWNQYMSIPWPDRIMFYLSVTMNGTDEQSRVIRRTLMRYLCLASIIVFQATSVRVKKRFPTMDHLIEAGIITHEEVKALDDVSTPHGKWWVPFVWSCNIVRDAFNKGLIADSFLFKTIIEEIMTYRGCLGLLYSYDWISVPLVYTQVTTLAVYTFFLGCTLGRQFLDPEQKYPGHDVDLYVPLFTLLQFFFYMGWLKVAEQLINPFGEDDDDFEMNWIIDRNMQVSLLTVDTLHGQFPTLTKDLYYGEAPPDYLPYTKSSSKHISLPHMGSTADIKISDEGMKLLTPMETIQEGVAVMNTTTKPDSGINTPITFSHKHQNLMSGTKSPNILFSRTSLHSYSKGSEDGHPPNILGSTLFKAKEKLGKWLNDQSSQVELNRLNAYHHNHFRHSSVDSTETLPSDILLSDNHPSQFTRLPILREHRNNSPPAEGPAVISQPSHLHHHNPFQSHTASQSFHYIQHPTLSNTTTLTQPPFSSHAFQSIHPALSAQNSQQIKASPTHTTSQPAAQQPQKPFSLLTRLSQRYPRTHTISLNHDNQPPFVDLPKNRRSSYYRHRYGNGRFNRDFDSQTLFSGSIENVNKIGAPSLPCVSKDLKLRHSPFFSKKTPDASATTSAAATTATQNANTLTANSSVGTDEVSSSLSPLNFDSKRGVPWTGASSAKLNVGKLRKPSSVSDLMEQNGDRGAKSGNNETVPQEGAGAGNNESGNNTRHLSGLSHVNPPKKDVDEARDEVAIDMSVLCQGQGSAGDDYSLCGEEVDGGEEDDEEGDDDDDTGGGFSKQANTIQVYGNNNEINIEHNAGVAPQDNGNNANIAQSINNNDISSAINNIASTSSNIELQTTNERSKLFSSDNNKTSTTTNHTNNTRSSNSNINIMITHISNNPPTHTNNNLTAHTNKMLSTHTNKNTLEDINDSRNEESTLSSMIPLLGKND